MQNEIYLKQIETNVAEMETGCLNGMLLRLRP